MYQRGVQGNIRPSSSSASASSPTNHPVHHSSSLCCGPPSACKPRRCALQPGWMDGWRRSQQILHPLLYLIINLLLFVTTPRPPPPPSQVTQTLPTLAADASFIARTGRRREVIDGWRHEGLMTLLHSRAMKVIWSVQPQLQPTREGGSLSMVLICSPLQCRGETHLHKDILTTE